jgi:amidohydrolase
LAENVRDEVVGWRRHLHRNPELSFEVEKSSRFVYETLESFGGLGGEDFSAYQQVTPGSFFLMGAGNKEKGITAPHHHPRFTIDEDSLENGVKMFVYATIKLFEKEGGT